MAKATTKKVKKTKEATCEDMLEAIKHIEQVAKVLHKLMSAYCMSLPKHPGVKVVANSAPGFNNGIVGNICPDPEEDYPGT